MTIASHHESPSEFTPPSVNWRQWELETIQRLLNRLDRFFSSKPGYFVDRPRELDLSPGTSWAADVQARHGWRPEDRKMLPLGERRVVNVYDHSGPAGSKKHRFRFYLRSLFDWNGLAEGTSDGAMTPELVHAALLEAEAEASANASREGDGDSVSSAVVLLGGYHPALEHCTTNAALILREPASVTGFRCIAPNSWGDDLWSALFPMSDEELHQYLDDEVEIANVISVSMLSKLVGFPVHHQVRAWLEDCHNDKRNPVMKVIIKDGEYEEDFAVLRALNEQDRDRYFGVYREKDSYERSLRAYRKLKIRAIAAPSDPDLKHKLKDRTIQIKAQYETLCRRWDQIHQRAEFKGLMSIQSIEPLYTQEEMDTAEGGHQKNEQNWDNLRTDSGDLSFGKDFPEDQ